MADHTDFKLRVTQAFDLLWREGSGESIALVTHGGVFRLMFREILKLGETSIDDCALAQLDFDGHSFRIRDVRGITIHDIKQT